MARFLTASVTWLNITTVYQKITEEWLKIIVFSWIKQQKYEAVKSCWVTNRETLHPVSDLGLCPLNTPNTISLTSHLNHGKRCLSVFLLKKKNTIICFFSFVAGKYSERKEILQTESGRNHPIDTKAHMPQHTEHQSHTHTRAHTHRVIHTRTQCQTD